MRGFIVQIRKNIFLEAKWAEGVTWFRFYDNRSDCSVENSLWRVWGQRQKQRGQLKNDYSSSRKRWCILNQVVAIKILKICYILDIFWRKHQVDLHKLHMKCESKREVKDDHSDIGLRNPRSEFAVSWDEDSWKSAGLGERPELKIWSCWGLDVY